jgi:two-component sensor histidine kinase
MNRKLNLKFLTEARERLHRLRTISENLDFGNGISDAAFSAMIDECQAELDRYNSNKTVLDGQRVVLKDFEVNIKDLSEKLFINVAAKHGKNSEEYVKAGGIRKVDRKKPKRKAAGDTKAGQ